MKLTLERRVRIIRFIEETRDIKVGTKIENYCDGMDNISQGEVVRRNEKYYIKWDEDRYEQSLIEIDLNNWRFTEQILPYLGFKEIL